MKLKRKAQTRYKLSKPMLYAMSCWLVLHGYNERSIIPRESLVAMAIDWQFTDITSEGAERIMQTTKIPKNFPMPLTTKFLMVSLTVIPISMTNLGESLRLWYTANREELISCGALLPETDIKTLV